MWVKKWWPELLVMAAPPALFTAIALMQRGQQAVAMFTLAGFWLVLGSGHYLLGRWRRNQPLHETIHGMRQDVRDVKDAQGIILSAVAEAAQPQAAPDWADRARVIRNAAS